MKGLNTCLSNIIVINMCCLNVPLTFALYYWIINPYIEYDEPLQLYQILCVPFISIATFITIVLDIIFLPFNLVSRCCIKYCCEHDKERMGSDMFYNIV